MITTNLDITPELNLIEAVVTQARQDAHQKRNKYLRRSATKWLIDFRVPVDGPLTRTRLGRNKDRKC